MNNLIESLQNFVLGLPEAVQFLGVALAAMVPFVENYGAVMIGSIAGIPIWAVVLMAILGNMAIIALITLISGRTRDAVLARRNARSAVEPAPADRRHQRIRGLFDRYGIPGVTLLGMLVVPTHLIAATLVSFGCARANVLIWQAVAITAYAGITGAMMLGLLSLGGV